MAKFHFRKTIISVVIIMLLLVSSIVISSICNDDFAVALEEEPDDILYEKANEKSDSEHVYITLPQEHILISDTFIVPFRVDYKYEITGFNYTSIGFNVLAANTINEQRIDFELQCIYGVEECVLSVNVELNSNQKRDINLYAFCKGEDVFLSSFAPDDAFEKYLNYELTKNRITDNQADVIRQDYWKDSVTEESYNTATSSDRNLTSAIKNQLKSISNKIINGQISTLDDSADTYISGKLEWIDDDGNIHPIRRVQVDICDYDSSLVSEVLGTVFTDNDGNYSFAFKNKDQVLDFENGGYDLYIKAYAGDSNAMVVKPEGGEYYYMSDQTAYMNVETGSTTVINMRINMSYTLGQAFQISQALITARDFAWNMQDEMPSDVTLRYPYGEEDCYYEEYYKRITLSYLPKRFNDKGEELMTSYSAWDAIMHEYGHHIQYDKNITEHLGGGHVIDENIIDHYVTCTDSTCDCAQPGATQAKYAGIRLAWGETWPTVFGIIAQKYFASRLSEISTVNDTQYTDFAGIDFDLETDSCALGEGSEKAIIHVLWDLFDGGTNDDDNIALGYQKWWDVTTGGQDKTFSSFVQRFYSIYPEYVKDMGDLLSLRGMAAEEIVYILGTTELTLTATAFMWNVQGGSDYFQNDSWDILIYNEDLTTSLVVSSTSLIAGTVAMGVVSDEQWATVISWPGEEIYVTVRSYQTDNPTTGGYISTYKKFIKPVYKTSTTNGGIIITGTYSPLVGNITIPSTIDDKDVIGIGSSAFKNQTELTSVTLPSSIETIGDRAFQFCYQLKGVYMSSTKVSRLEAYTFDTCALNSITLPSTLTYIGEGVFIRANKPLRKLSGITYIGDYAFAYVNTENIVITSATEHIGNNAFLGCENLTIYTTNSQIASDWHSNWNSSARPVVWGCSITSGYVVSFEKTESNPSNANATNGISDPYRSGYSFDGWYTTSDFSGTAYTDLATAPNGILYAKWTKSSCVAAGTLITLADGTQKAVEELTGNEQLLVWNMLTGTFDVAPILFIDSDPVSMYQIIELSFSDGTTVKVIDEHAFWDYDLNKYVYVREDAEQYIGHWFNKQTTDEEGNLISVRVRLDSVNIYTQTTTAWSPVTYGHLCLYVNGMLSMPGATEAFTNIFDVDPETMKYDTAKMEQDIATYGLYTYEEFNALIPVSEAVFNAFNGQYLKVAIGKGLIDLNGISALIEMYAVFF